jgi:hypothetical protein
MRVIHLRKSSTLADLSREQGFSDWRPIWIYNTKVKQIVLCNEPHALIPAGTTILIPNTAQHYDHILATLRSTKLHLQEDMSLTFLQLQEAKKSADAFGSGVDFTADIATIFFTSGVKAVRYTGIVRRQMLEKTAIDTLQKTTAFVGNYHEEGISGVTAEKASEALTKQVLRRKAANAARGFGKSFATGMASEAIGHQFGELARLIAITALEGAQAALESLQPSKLAQFALKWKTGESPAETYHRAVSTARRTATDSVHRLDASIKRLRAEKQLIYGNDAAGAPLTKGASPIH